MAPRKLRVSPAGSAKRALLEAQFLGKYTPSGHLIVTSKVTDQGPGRPVSEITRAFLSRWQ
ncbi:MAG TPA: hypothetical protein VG963_33800, partial [Polyangiaceae bacterium]|nr:hypothetical protein [Polyangiaceae bacterium]